MNGSLNPAEACPLFLEHLIQSEVNGKLDGKVITCAKYDEKYSRIHGKHRLEEDFPEHIIGCKLLPKDEKIVTVTSRNILTIRKSNSLEIVRRVQCEYYATSICSLILGETLQTLRVFFGSVIGDLIDWNPNKVGEPVKRKGHKGMIFSIVSDSTRVFTISDDRTVRMWSLATGFRDNGPICTVYGHTARPYSICVDEHHGMIYTGGIEQTLFSWKYDREKIQLLKKTVLSIGVIRKINQTDKSTLIISSQDGDVVEIDTSVSGESPEILAQDIVNFAHVKDSLVLLNAKNEFIAYDTDSMERILFRCSDIRHMSSCDDSVVAWNKNMLIFFDGSHVRRLKLSMNIISAVCDSANVAVKTIDGFTNIHNFEDHATVKLLKRFKAPNPAMIPSVFSVFENLLILGSTHGELYHETLNDDEIITQSLTRRDSTECFGGKEVTFIEPIPGTTCFTALGKTGVWSTFKITESYEVKILSSRTFSASSRMAWPSKILTVDDQKLILGFYGTSLIIWNASNGNPVFDSYCGGGHRAWKIRESIDPSVLNFDYIRDTELCRQQVHLFSKKHLTSTPHSSPIVSTAGSANYLVTVSLDGNLCIADNKAKPILTMFVGENLLCSDVYENGEDVHVATGGGKSSLSVWKFRRGELENHTFWLRHASRPDEGRIVSTKVMRRSGRIYFIASYSSGTLEVLQEADDSLQSVSVIELEDVLGIGSKLAVVGDQVFVGTSGSYLLRLRLLEDGKCLEEASRVKLSDRSGVTALAVDEDQNAIVGCDSGHVYKVSRSNITKVHSHLSTVVGIAVEGSKVHSVSLDCALLTSNGSEAPIRKPTIVDMPGGMVETGDSSLVVVGNGIQVIKLL